MLTVQCNTHTKKKSKKKNKSCQFINSIARKQDRPSSFILFFVFAFVPPAEHVKQGLWNINAKQQQFHLIFFLYSFLFSFHCRSGSVGQNWTKSRWKCAKKKRIIEREKKKFTLKLYMRMFCHCSTTKVYLTKWEKKVFAKDVEVKFV